MDILIAPLTSPSEEKRKEIFNKEIEAENNDKTSLIDESEETKTTSDLESDIDDINLIQKDPNTNKKVLNKKAYNKLHHSSHSEVQLYSLDKIKQKFKPNNDNTFISVSESVQSDLTDIKTPTTKEKSKIPVPKPRQTKRAVDASTKDLNSNFVDNKSDQSENEITIVRRRTSSVSTVDKFNLELNLFTMDPSKKDKKRTNSIRRIFSGGLFGKSKNKTKPTAIPVKDFDENYQNESNNFSRQTPYRHTVTCDSFKTRNSPSYTHMGIKPMEPISDKKYANLHINSFNKIRQSFNNPDELKSGIKYSTDEYVCMDKGMSLSEKPPLAITKYRDNHHSSSSSTLDSEKLNTYENALVAEAELRNVRMNEEARKLSLVERLDVKERDSSRDTPPRALETYQNVTIASPKKLTLELKERPKVLVEDTYGTVFDSIDSRSSRNAPPRSPSLEGTKLRMDQNREVLKVKPRIKSPVTIRNEVASDTLIATELLKNDRKKSNNDSSHQNLEIELDYPDKLSPQAESTPENRVTSKPPIQQKPFLPKPNFNLERTNAQVHSSQSISPISRNSPIYASNNEGYDRQMHFIRNQPSPINEGFVAPANQNMQPRMMNGSNYGTYGRQQVSSPTNRFVYGSQMQLPQNQWRASNQNMMSNGQDTLRNSMASPVNMRNSLALSNSSNSPKKEDIRKSVEAYYWNEIRKMKEQEDYNLYMCQMQMSQFGFAEDPTASRRSRSISNIPKQNTRRSSSVPRSTTKTDQVDASPEMRMNYNRSQNRLYPMGYPQQPQYNMNINNFVRSSPERRTVSNTSEYELNRPIFRRGSLTQRPDSTQTLNKKVSFSGQQQNTNANIWPTKNGYTKSPPQRRLEKQMSTGSDDVFVQTNAQNIEPIYMQKQNNGYMSEQEVALRNVQQNVYGYTPNNYAVRGSENFAIYGRPPPSGRLSVQPQSHQEMYGRIDHRRHNSVQNGRPINEPIYGARPPVPVRQISLPQPMMQRRQLFVGDSVYGTFGGYQQNPQVNEPIYGARVAPPKQVTVRNKVCDMYGKIHEQNGEIYGTQKVQESGVLMGRLQQDPVNGSPSSFRRGTRLTASANDMHFRRQEDPRYNSDYQIRFNQVNGVPDRPLPKIPQSPPSSSAMLGNGFHRSSVMEMTPPVDTSNGFGSVKKKRSFFGK